MSSLNQPDGKAARAEIAKRKRMKQDRRNAHPAVWTGQRYCFVFTLITREGLSPVFHFGPVDKKPACLGPHPHRPVASSSYLLHCLRRKNFAEFVSGRATWK